MVFKTYRLRLYPNREQRDFFERSFQAVRFVKNLCIEQRFLGLDHGVFVKRADQQAQLVDLKKEATFLKDAPSPSLQYAVRDVDVAFQRYFKRASRRPRFHSRKCGWQSFQLTNQNVAVGLQHIKMTKAGCVRYRDSRRPVGRLIRATVSRTPSFKYFISLVVEQEKPAALAGTKSVGLDFSMKDFYVASDGTRAKCLPKLCALHQKLAAYQVRLSKMLYGSRNYQKQCIKIAKVYEKMRNIKDDYLHKLSRKLVDKFDLICLETLDLQGMSARDSKYKFGKRIRLLSWYRFTEMLTYKAQYSGKQVVKVSRWLPSSQLCSVCGSQRKLTLADRIYSCPYCGSELDRDVNAAVNILVEGEALATNRRVGGACLVENETSTLVGI